MVAKFRADAAIDDGPNGGGGGGGGGARVWVAMPSWYVLPIAPWLNMTLNPRAGYHLRIVMPQGWMLLVQLDSVRHVYLTINYLESEIQITNA